MASNLENKYIKKCPLADEFKVNKSYSNYYIQYVNSKNAIINLDNDWQNVTKCVSKLEDQILDLNESIDSQDYKKQTDDLLNALDMAMKNVDSNMLSLYRSLLNRLKDSAESDQWFSSVAKDCINFIQGTSMAKRASSGGSSSSGVKATAIADALSNVNTPTGIQAHSFEDLWKSIYGDSTPNGKQAMSFADFWKGLQGTASEGVQAHSFEDFWKNINGSSTPNGRQAMTYADFWKGIQASSNNGIQAHSFEDFWKSINGNTPPNGKQAMTFADFWKGLQASSNAGVQANSIADAMQNINNPGDKK